MSRIRVGVDVDGVMRDFHSAVIDKAKPHGLTIEYQDITNWDFLRTNAVNGKSLAYHIFDSKEWAEDVFAKAPVLDGAKQAYNLLCEYYDVYIVSDQANDTKHYTDLWLRENGFNRHVGAIYTSNKIQAPCQVLIDDNYEHIKKYNDSARLGILIDRPWNKKHEYHLRASQLIDAYNLL